QGASHRLSAQTGLQGRLVCKEGTVVVRDRSAAVSSGDRSGQRPGRAVSGTARAGEFSGRTGAGASSASQQPDLAITGPARTSAGESGQDAARCEQVCAAGGAEG